MGELSDKCQTMMGANLSALLLHRVAPAKLLLFRGPKAAFLGAAIDAPRKNIDVFVDEALGALVDGSRKSMGFSRNGSWLQ